MLYRKTKISKNFEALPKYKRENSEERKELDSPFDNFLHPFQFRSEQPMMMMMMMENIWVMHLKMNPKFKHYLITTIIFVIHKLILVYESQNRGPSIVY